METLLSRHWHHIPSQEVLELLETDQDRGLDTFEVGHRQKHFGANVLTERKGPGPLIQFLSQFQHPLVYILLAAAIITAALQEWVDSGVILGVVLVNAIIGFIQESNATKAIEALARATTTRATVVRGGDKRTIRASELVPGDIVFLQSGDKVPADLRLVHSRELQIDESALTGESASVEKSSGTLDGDIELAERKNMAYASTLVTSGTGVGVVSATGDDTEVGRIAELVATAETLATPLTRKIARFSGVLLYVILGMAGITFVVGALRGGVVDRHVHGRCCAGGRRNTGGYAGRDHHHARHRCREDGETACHYSQASCGGDVGQYHRHLFR